MHILLAALVLLMVLIAARVVWVIVRLNRSSQSTPLTPEWRPDPPKVKKRRSIPVSILIALLTDPFVLLVMLMCLGALLGPFRPVHEWIR